MLDLTAEVLALQYSFDSCCDEHEVAVLLFGHSCEYAIFAKKANLSRTTMESTSYFDQR